MSLSNGTGIMYAFNCVRRNLVKALTDGVSHDSLAKGSLL